MPELIKTAEVIGKGLQFAKKLGQTMLEPFKGGWAGLGKTSEVPPTPANITVYEDEEHITRGQE